MLHAIRIAALLVGLVAPAAAAPPIDFNRDVRPILSNNCYQCHGPDESARKADLRLDTRAGATADGTIVPGKPNESELLKRVLSADPSEAMPPPKFGKKLTAKDIVILREWVAQGAPYAIHWSYVKPERPAPPTLPPALQARVVNPIDAFVFARLHAVGLTPEPEADRLTLARRVSLDLTGLPPTIAEVEAFVADQSPGAYERYVDQTLAKPAFGEHWARMWLDLARYADSAGYADDPARTIWAYRDYVVRSFNANKSFDLFTIEQMAGDLLPNPTDEQVTATAFHRNTLTNSEGGTSDEEFRTAAVVDRVNTTLAVWMGTSMACAQCHTHKYDPISQTEYFRFYAVLNNTADFDRRDESPLLTIGDSPQKKAMRAKLGKLAASLDKLPKSRSAFVRLAATKVPAAAVRAETAKYEPVTTVPILRELPAGERRITKIQLRGNFLDTSDVVTEGVPSAFHPLAKGAKPDRLAVARWLVAADNPLTPRVMANRLWEQVFGTGLVRTAEEFGAQGELPSHPELLDWLAVEFRSGWNVKAFLKTLVTSATYRQASRVTPEKLVADPDNRLLSRGPRYRLSAEAIRDQALAVSGLLSAKMYGPPARPPQPTFGLNAAFGRSMDWQTSPGEDRYRRGLYTEWRRTNPYPSMATFDAPSREACTLRRVRTNTPLQALVTLNDPVFVEAAQALARKMAATSGGLPDKLAAGFRQCLLRPPTEKEAARLAALYRSARWRYAFDTTQAKKLATDPLGPVPKGANVGDLAALTVVGNVLLNLDEMFMRR